MLVRVFVHLPPFISQIVDFIYGMVLILILIYFEWRDNENQQYVRFRQPLPFTLSRMVKWCVSACVRI